MDLAQTRAKLELSETENAGLRAQLAHSTTANTAAQATIADLQARVAELERSAKLTSENSGKPPSSDGVAKPERKVRTASQRNHKERKPSGGQAGHAGATLRQVKNPTRTVDHFPVRCDGCGAKLKRSSASGYAARQVFDLPEPRPLEVTEHRAHACWCGCGTVTKGEFPRGVGAPVQYGGAGPRMRHLLERGAVDSRGQGSADDERSVRDDDIGSCARGHRRTQSERTG
jgi:hypothetical protein